MPNTRPSNVGALSEGSTIQGHAAKLTSTFSVVTAKYPWQRRLSNDLALADTARVSNVTVHADTGSRLSNDTPLQTS